MHSRLALAALVLLTACGGKADAPKSASTDSTKAAGGPELAARLEGFQTPESALYDADQDAWFITNINGNPSVKDNNGFISRIKPDASANDLQFIAGGRLGVTLNAPKGQAIMGDTLWVADIDALRGFNRRTGLPVATIEFGKQAKFLNDVAVGPDGALYVTDTGILIDSTGKAEHPGPDRIFKVSGRTIEVAVEGDLLERPNGIAWDSASSRFIVVPFGGKTLLGWVPGSAPTQIGAGPGGQDGVEVLPDGRILVSSWADSTVFVVGANGNTRLLSGMLNPADIGVDRKRMQVAVPFFTLNKVEVWSIPPAK